LGDEPLLMFGVGDLELDDRALDRGLSIWRVDTADERGRAALDARDAPCLFFIRLLVGSTHTLSSQRTVLRIGLSIRFR
jgi:hypothetical protein